MSPGRGAGPREFAALKPALLFLVAPTLAAATVAALGFAIAWMFWGQADGRQYRSVEFRNPFDLLSVIGFAVLLGVVIVLGRAVGETFGATGAILIGLADVDAVTVSMARLTPDTLDPAHAALAILAAVASDTVSKVAIGAGIGRGWFAADLAVMALGCIGIGGVACWLTLALLAL